MTRGDRICERQSRVDLKRKAFWQKINKIMSPNQKQEMHRERKDEAKLASSSNGLDALFVDKPQRTRQILHPTPCLLSSMLIAGKMLSTISLNLNSYKLVLKCLSTWSKLRKQSPS